MFASTKRKKWILGVLTVLVLAFIWGNSCMNAEDSGSVSDGLGAWLAQFLGSVSITVIRKLAHFSEFAALGFLLQWQRVVWKKETIAAPVLFALLCAMADETIQLFSPGRASAVTDVWIDFAGILAGTAALLLLYKLSRRKKP